MRTAIFAAFLFALTGCVSQDDEALSQSPEATRTSVETVTVDGRSYDVVYDPYVAENVTIYGIQETVIDGELPRAAIVSQATSCQYVDTGVSNYGGMEHPSRDDLQLLDTVTVQCG